MLKINGDLKELRSARLNIKLNKIEELQKQK